MTTLFQSPLLRPIALGIYLLFFAVGLVGALVIPTLSLFLANELNVRPLLVGIPFAGIALASIIYNQSIGYWSDRLADRRPLVSSLCVLGAASCLVFAFSRQYWLVAGVAVVLFSLSMVSFSQLLAYSLDYAERCIPLERIPLYNAVVRAQIAFAWVAGPPAGFLLAAHAGFKVTYCLAAGLFAVVALLVVRFLPRLQAPRPFEETAATKSPTTMAPLSWKPLLLCFCAFSLMWGANNAYLISLPLYLDRELAIGSEWVGWIMGTCALLEVPFMLLSGYLAMRIPVLVMVRFAGIAGLLLYTGVYFSSELWQLFSLQLCNAIFIGVLAGLGVSVIQQLMPGRSGSASALYTNTTHAGALFSSLMVGLVADYWNYQTVFLFNVFLVCLAIAAFAMVRQPAAHPERPA
ncbi:sugar efflux transporter [Cellvibrio polysaccharolyticus]|uniref:sugar efflux transporter n=1 Tax=Cellvibrio polysaccharolyticus TaxID=2082724 RepID=UPI002E2D601C|nr:sugar efflux transporter [Cellvibrio polysaccharolyticus]